MDILIIKLYIKNTLKNPNSAKQISGEIIDKIYSLDFSPERYVEVELHGIRIRKMPVRNYNVFYSVDKDNQIVTVVRILYSGVDINKVAIN